MKKSVVLAVVLATSIFSMLGSGCNSGSSAEMQQLGNPRPTPHPVGPAPVPTPLPTVPIIAPVGPITPIGPVGCQCDPNGVCPDCIVESAPGGTRDTDLEQADLQQITVEQRANNLVSQFGMNFESATHLAQLADQVREMAVNNQSLTTEDRDAITASALSIAGITTDEVNNAFNQSMAGDNSATEALLAKAAQTLGMQSSASVSQRLLPALGVQLQ